jgi:hypothetical protein
MRSYKYTRVKKANQITIDWSADLMMLESGSSAVAVGLMSRLGIADRNWRSSLCAAAAARPKQPPTVRLYPSEASRSACEAVQP